MQLREKVWAQGLIIWPGEQFYQRGIIPPAFPKRNYVLLLQHDTRAVLWPRAASSQKLLIKPTDTAGFLDYSKLPYAGKLLFRARAIK